MEQHAAAVLAFALRRSSSRADAEDVRQKTFEVAWRRLDDLPADAPLPWLYAVARYVLANERRGRRRRERLQVRLAGASPRQAELEPETRDEVRLVLAAVSRLRPQHQEILLLSAWEGLSHAEIGVVLGISERASALRLHRARTTLEEILAKEGSGRRTHKGSSGKRNGGRGRP